jgi:VanZ family protein
MTYAKGSISRKFALLGAWSLLAFIAYATVAPIQDRPSSPTSTNIEHIAAFVVLGSAFCVAYPRRLALVCSIVLGSAVLLELFQLLTPDRHGRIQDALEKMTGGLVGVLVGWALLEVASRWFQFRSVEAMKVVNKKSEV